MHDIPGIWARHLLQQIITPTNKALAIWSQSADELVLGTACQESACGRALVQYNDGPALGAFQMEPKTFYDIHANYLAFQPALLSRLQALAQDCRDPQEMVWNLRFAAAMCRIHYRRVKEALPTAGNLNGQAQYWKAHYNTRLGKGTVEEYVASWVRHTRE